MTLARRSALTRGSALKPGKALSRHSTLKRKTTVKKISAKRKTGAGARREAVAAAFVRDGWTLLAGQVTPAHAGVGRAQGSRAVDSTDRAFREWKADLTMLESSAAIVDAVPELGAPSLPDPDDDLSPGQRRRKDRQERRDAP